jgi:hypothetical protein
MRRRVFLVGLLAAGIGTAAAVTAAWPGGVRVTVTNRGPEALADVVIHVTGHSYALGTLEPGRSRTVPVSARGESHVELESTRGSGERRRLNAGGYFEAGYEGTIEIELQTGEIVRNEHRVAVSAYGL